MGSEAAKHCDAGVAPFTRYRLGIPLFRKVDTSPCDVTMTPLPYGTALLPTRFGRFVKYAVLSPRYALKKRGRYDGIVKDVRGSESNCEHDSERGRTTKSCVDAITE
jgi:hypothetical protein